jgi:hypothetical protein
MLKKLHEAAQEGGQVEAAKFIPSSWVVVGKYQLQRRGLSRMVPASPTTSNDHFHTKKVFCFNRKKTPDRNT